MFQQLNGRAIVLGGLHSQVEQVTLPAPRQPMTDLYSRNSSIPTRPHSRPIPDSLNPPCVPRLSRGAPLIRMRPTCNRLGMIGIAAPNAAGKAVRGIIIRDPIGPVANPGMVRYAVGRGS